MSLFRYLLQKVAGAALSMLGAALLVSAFLHLVPGDPVDALLGEQASVVDRNVLRACIGYDDPTRRPDWLSAPLWQRGVWWTQAAASDFGSFARDLVKGSLKTSVPPCRDGVFPRIRKALPRTALLAIVALWVAIAVGVPLGVLAAARKGTAWDTAASTFALVGASLPRFWLGPLLILAFAIGLGWLPVSGSGSFRHVVLPAVTLGLAMAALLTRMTRASLLEVIRREYVVAARGRGVTEAVVLWKHALRNALLPVITVLGLELGALLGGAIITERVFAWPGMGLLLLTSVEKRDFNAVRACVLVFTLVYLASNLLADLVNAAIDPRLRNPGP